ncbi:MAG: hypothetical protein FJY54_07565 [Betaproteobacteria bacterium]|nr:hypothetical protein [Betaproteobacteria bacterium]
MHTTLESVLILLATAVLVVVVFRSLTLPPMLGYLIVGTVIGPHALGWIPDTEGARFLAEIGIVFLMFSIGLEFSLPKLITMRGIVFGLGAAQMGITMLVVWGAAMALGLTWQAQLLRHALGVGARRPVERRELQVERGEHARDARVLVPLAVELVHVFQEIAPGEVEGRIEPLGQVGEPRARDSGAVRDPEDLDAPAVRAAEIEQALDQSRLARAVDTHQPEGLARPDLERKISERRHAGVGLQNLREAQCRGAHVRCSAARIVCFPAATSASLRNSGSRGPGLTYPKRVPATTLGAQSRAPRPEGFSPPAALVTASRTHLVCASTAAALWRARHASCVAARRQLSSRVRVSASIQAGSPPQPESRQASCRPMRATASGTGTLRRCLRLTASRKLKLSSTARLNGPCTSSGSASVTARATSSSCTHCSSG